MLMEEESSQIESKYSEDSEFSDSDVTPHRAPSAKR